MLSTLKCINSYLWDCLKIIAIPLFFNKGNIVNHQMSWFRKKKITMIFNKVCSEIMISKTLRKSILDSWYEWFFLCLASSPNLGQSHGQGYATLGRPSSLPVSKANYHRSSSNPDLAGNTPTSPDFDFSAFSGRNLDRTGSMKADEQQNVPKVRGKKVIQFSQFAMVCFFLWDATMLPSVNERTGTSTSFAIPV